MLTEQEIADIQKIAEDNDGHCDRCRRLIQIYRYKINQQMASVLRAMRKVVDEKEKNEVNFDELTLPYRLGSQRTKMRLHGLIVKVKDADGHQIKNTWLIAKKGGDFLRGVAIPEKVVVFDNQVIGHEGKTVTIHQVMGEPEFEAEKITPAEAEAYSDLRQGQRNLEVEAVYKGSIFGSKFDVGKTYKLVMEKLKMGSPVVILVPKKASYKDIAAFQRDWEIIKKGV